MNPIEVIVTATLGGVIGGGTIAGLTYRALKERLQGDFEKVFAKVAFEHVALMAKETADNATDRIIRIEESDNALSVRLAETLTRLERQLRDMDQRHREAQKEIDRTVALLTAMEKRFDRHIQ